MTQIVADCRQVDPRLQKRYGSAVPHTVRVKSLLAEIRNIRGSTGKTPGEDVADPEPSQGLATVIEKHASVRPQSQILLLRERAQDRSGLRPQGTVAFLLPFTEQSHLKGPGQLEVASPQIGDLLHTGSRIEHRGQESVVAGSWRGSAIYGFENRVDLLPL